MKKGAQKHFNDENEAEIIAKEYLDPLVNKILKILYLLVKFNQKNSEKFTKYDYIMYAQLKHHDTKLVASIFKETFKRAEFIFGDKSSLITNKDGLDSDALDET
mmetsp:Transcript_20991/g.20121  ORF Transcript_20991/g.20121 Transcript_20991/m.20121 type:complete len:104 (+) Transcript_20991:2102-2413(+)